jgi:type IV pilus assembly protein PilV
MHLIRSLRQGGTSLIEVLIALVVVSVGLLGIAKMQALAISSTRDSSVRSLIAVEAASIASAMHANQAYWQTYLTSNSLTPFAATLTYGTGSSPPPVTIASNDPTLAYSTNCQSAVCTPQAMAANDLQTWALSLWNLSQTVGVAAVTPPTIACVGTSPVICTVEIQWSENIINGVNGAVSGGSTSTAVYNLMVQP